MSHSFLCGAFWCVEYWSYSPEQEGSGSALSLSYPAACTQRDSISNTLASSSPTMLFLLWEAPYLTPLCIINVSSMNGRMNEETEAQKVNWFAQDHKPGAQGCHLLLPCQHSPVCQKHLFPHPIIAAQAKLLPGNGWSPTTKGERKLWMILAASFSNIRWMVGVSDFLYLKTIVKQTQRLVWF